MIVPETINDRWAVILFQHHLQLYPAYDATHIYCIYACVDTHTCAHARVTEVIPSPVIIRLTRSERVLVAFVCYDQAICLQYAGRDARNLFMCLSLGWRRDGVLAAHYSRCAGKLVNGGVGHTLGEMLTAHVSIYLLMPYFFLHIISFLSLSLSLSLSFSLSLTIISLMLMPSYAPTVIRLRNKRFRNVM